MFTDFRLKVFKTTADLLSYTAASKNLHITQPAVSKHINELEKQLGFALFNRRGNKISLTPQGEQMLMYTRKILNEYKLLSDAFANDATIESGTLDVGASTTIAQYILPPILAKFKQRYKNVKVTMITGNSEQIEQAIGKEQIDIGLIEGDIKTTNLHYEQLKEDSIVLLTSAKTSCDKTISVEMLKQLPLVVRERGSGTLDVIDNALARHNIYHNNLNIIMQLGSTESIKRYLQYSDAFALISAAAVADELESGKLKAIGIKDVNIYRKLRFVSVHGQYGRLVSIFKQFCLDNI